MSFSDPPGGALPRIRPVEMFPYGPPEKRLFALRDPERFAQPIVLPVGAAVLVSLMNGQRTLAEIQRDFQSQVGAPVSLVDLQRLVAQLDAANYLASERFEERRRRELDDYRNARVRPAAHAGGAYHADPVQLRIQLDALFTCEKGPGAPTGSPPASIAGESARGDENGNGASPAKGRLCGVLSPHIDLHRGGPAFAWAYKQIAERSDAEVFVIFGTAHSHVSYPFSLTRKDFETPLGTVKYDEPLVDAIVRRHEELVGAGAGEKLLADEHAHRHEHSIEFQVLFLQYLLGERREFTIVPILTGSLHEFVVNGAAPNSHRAIDGFFTAVREAAAERGGKVCYISGGDLAHIGRRFGDADLLDETRLAEQSTDDRQLLEAACQADSAAFFGHVASQNDRNRICGLAPTYALLEVTRPTHGELLAYDQAVEPDGTSCVSFASLAFYHDGRGE